MTAEDGARRGRRFELPWPVLLALRYLRSGRRDAFVSFLSAVAVGGIALGVVALVLALSALNGLQAALRDEVLRRTPEIEVRAPAGRVLDGIAARIGALDGVEQASKRLRGNGWVLVAGSARPVELVGYEGSLPDSFPGARERQPGVYTSDRFARLHGLAPGDTFEIASTRSRLSPLGPVPRTRRVALTETYEHDLLEPSEVVAVPYAVAESLLGSASSHLVVRTGDLDRALSVAARIGSLEPEADVLTWQDLNAPLLLALRLEKRLTFVAAFLIVLVGALALVSDLSLIIASRRGEIGILGTMGATVEELRRAFVTLGALLAGAGLALGAAAGMVAAYLLDRWEVIRLPGDFFLLDHIPFLVEAADLGWIALATLAVALVCCWIGAGRVSDLRPVEALRA
jgi:lipoprotein-releasing system permease protein